MDIERSVANRAFIEDLKTFLEPCYRQYHENILNGAGNLWVHSKVESEAVRAGQAAPSLTLCRQTTFLARMLLKKAYGETWNVGGGHCLSKHHRAADFLTPEQLESIQSSDEGAFVHADSWFVTPEGRMYGIHYWLEKDGLILDLTADQFGHENLVITTIDDERYKRQPERCKAASVSSARSTAMKWLHNDFGFWARANKYYEQINTAHTAFIEKYPAVRALVEPESELSR